MGKNQILMKKTLLVLSVLMLTVFAFNACSSDDDEPSIVGTWHGWSADSLMECEIEFKSDSTVYLSSVSDVEWQAGVRVVNKTGISRFSYVKTRVVGTYKLNENLLAIIPTRLEMFDVSTNAWIPVEMDLEMLNKMYRIRLTEDHLILYAEVLYGTEVDSDGFPIVFTRK